jgi:hypothetical protein
MPVKDEYFKSEILDYWSDDDEKICAFDDELKAYIDNGARKSDDDIENFAKELSDKYVVFDDIAELEIHIAESHWEAYINNYY